MAPKRPRKPRKGNSKKPTAKRTVFADGAVVDIRDKRVEKLTEQIVSLASAITHGLDTRVAQIVGLYKTWERSKPDQALKPHDKLEMVRLGFVGPGGYERCHDPTRLPTAALDPDIQRDHELMEVAMCPAMETGKCQAVWRAMATPPCHLLLLEVHHGLGGGALDDSVQEVVDDFGKSGGPEQNEASFARAERLVHEYSEHE